jgi:hypothetical protein
MATDERFAFAELFRRLRTGPGIVGRNVPVAVTIFAVFGVAVWRLQSDMLIMIALGGVGVLAVFYFAAMLWYANKHPHHSAMDGSDLKEHLRIQMSAHDAKMINLPEPKLTANTTLQIEGKE